MAKKTESKIIEFEETISIDEYLSNFSKKRNVDNIFKKWFISIDNRNPKKIKNEWDILFEKFMRGE